MLIRRRLKHLMAEFLAEQRGGVSLLMLPMFVLFIFGTGMAIDFARHEVERIDAQDALDRGVLSAASASTNAEAVEIVRRFFATRTFNSSQVEPIITADIEGGPGSLRTVAARVNYPMPTTVLSLVGIQTVGIIAGAKAEEQEPVDGEIALVLDISGSMARETTRVEAEDGSVTNPTRLTVLQGAASEFVTDILNSPGGVNTSISLVPYAGQVNPGRFFFERLVNSTQYDFESIFDNELRSHCIEFTDSDFDERLDSSLGLPPRNSRAQTPHFQHFNFERLRGQATLPVNPDGGNNAEWGWCPTDLLNRFDAVRNVDYRGVDELAIVPHSDNEEMLVKRISRFRGHDGTGTQIGMKWGLAMLAPSTRPYISELASTPAALLELDGLEPVPDRFSNRPQDFGKENVVKTIVLMTDGNIRFQQRPRPENYESEEDIESFGYDEEQVRPIGGGLTARNTTQFKVSESILNFAEQGLDEALRFNQLIGLCELAKSKGIVVYTIGFDVPNGSQAQTAMQDCATGPEFFFDVQGGELFDAFDKISAEFTALRLFE